MASAILLTGTLACSPRSVEIEESKPSDLSALADRFWDAYLNWHPLQATYLGENRLNDRVRDITPQGRDARQREVAALSATLKAIDVESLSPADLLTYLALDHQFQSQLAQQTCNREVWVVDHREGFQLDFLHIATAQPLNTPVDGERMIRRWNAIPEYIDEHISNLRSGIEVGLVAARVSVHRTIVQLDALLERPVQQWPIYAPAGSNLNDWPEGTRHDFREAIREAAITRIKPAYLRFRNFLRDELYPSSRTGRNVGLSGIPGGAECYSAKIRDFTTLDLVPEEIHSMGVTELERAHTEIADLGMRVLGTSDITEIQARLRSDPEMHFRWPGEIVQGAQTAYDRALAEMPNWFGIHPTAGLVIRPIPLYEAPQSVLAYYREPSPDGSRPGIYYVNTYQPETRPRYQAEVLTFHEGIPGHQQQTAIAQEAIGLPAFRKHLGAMAFVEGWALYSERLADDMGLYSSDLDRLGLLSYEAWRASRLIVDTGIHSFGWTRDQAIQFLEANTLLAEANIENEVDRYITSPAQALAYKLGQIEILHLRDEAKQRLGDRFSISEFHDRVLENGALSLPALRQAIEIWLQNQNS